MKLPEVAIWIKRNAHATSGNACTVQITLQYVNIGCMKQCRCHLTNEIKSEETGLNNRTKVSKTAAQSIPKRMLYIVGMDAVFNFN